MWFKVNQATKAVESLGASDEEMRQNVGADLGHNGQHYQLSGHILAEWDGKGIKLYHPKTEAFTGHYDVWYSPNRRDGKWGVELRQYQYFAELSGLASSGAVKYVWPTGGWDLIATIVAIEDYIAQTIGAYDPRMAKWVEGSFRFVMSEPAKVVEVAI